MLLLRKNVIGDCMKEYLDIFGIKFMKEEFKPKELPVYVISGRKFYWISNDKNVFILVRIGDEEDFGSIAYEKQMMLIYEKYEIPVAFEYISLTTSQKTRLIQMNIPFICDEKQYYLPFLGFALSESIKKRKIVRASKLMPVTQALLLYMIYQSNGHPVLKKDAAAALGVTKMSITRASEQLVTLGLILEESRGRECYMTIDESPRVLLDKAKDYMINPIQKILYVEDEEAYREYLLSGESALSANSMLSVPSIQSRAVFKNKVSVDGITEVDVKWDDTKAPVRLELWKYDPELFSKNGVVDPISLSLCYSHETDERIVEAIEEYMEKSL